MKDRIREVRQHFGLSMEKFGARIGIGKTSISLLESGKNNPSAQTITLICREFNVNEHWLRTGEGEMFEQTRESVLDRLTAEYGLDQEQRAVVESFLDLTPPERDVILKYIRKVYARTASVPALDIDAEVEAYRQELLSQKKAEGTASASAGTADAG